MVAAWQKQILKRKWLKSEPDFEIVEVFRQTRWIMLNACTAEAHMLRKRLQLQH